MGMHSVQNHLWRAVWSLRGFAGSSLVFPQSKRAKGPRQKSQSAGPSWITSLFLKPSKLHWVTSFSRADDASHSADVQTPSDLCKKPPHPHHSLLSGDTPQSASIMTPSGKLRTQGRHQIMLLNENLSCSHTRRLVLSDASIQGVYSWFEPLDRFCRVWMVLYSASVLQDLEQQHPEVLGSTRNQMSLQGFSQWSQTVAALGRTDQ